MRRPDVHLAPMDRVLDPIERHHHLDEFGLVELERQIGGGEQPRHGDPQSAERRSRIGRAGPGAHQPGAVAVAHGRAGAEQRVLPPDVGVGVDRDGGHLELGPAGALIQRFDVRQLVHVAEIAGVELVGGERVEHERVVGIGAVGDVDRAGHEVLCGGRRNGEAAERRKVPCALGLSSSRANRGMTPTAPRSLPPFRRSAVPPLA